MQKFYFLMGRPSTRRFPPSDCAMLATQAQNQLSMDLGIPIGTLDPIPTVAGQQLYQITEVITIRHLYLSGPGDPFEPTTSLQELFPTDDFTLGGTITQQWDNSSGLVQGSPIQSPRYLTTPPQAYPIQAGITGRGGGTVPMNSVYGGVHGRPCYYVLEGYVGIVPIPVDNSYNIIINAVRECPPLNISSDPSPLPYLCIDAIAWKMVENACFADDSSRATIAHQAYEEQIADKLTPYLRHYQAGKANGLVPVPTDFNRHRRGRWI